LDQNGLPLGYYLIHLARLDDFGFNFKVVQCRGSLAARKNAVGVLEQRFQFWAEVGVVEERFFFMANVHKSSVEVGHGFDDFAQKNVTYREIIVRLLVV
jgi:hypothetical protein